MRPKKKNNLLRHIFVNKKWSKIKGNVGWGKMFVYK